MVVQVAVGLALVGFYISAYFVAVSYGCAAASRWVPRVCRLDGAGCDTIVHTRQARLLGVPNAVVGLVYYAGIIGAAASGLLLRSPVTEVFLAAAILSVLAAIYLIHALYRVLGVPCILCLSSHVVNVLLAALFGWAVLGG